MPDALKVRTIVLCSLLLSSLLALPAVYAGSGVKAFMPAEDSVVADGLPFVYNGSFVVLNDGYTDGVYVVRVSVDKPQAISWVNVSRPAFVLSPGESTIIDFSISAPSDTTIGGPIDFIFIPALLPTKVEPYLDPFAKYVIHIDRYKFTLTLPGSFGGMSVDEPVEVIFTDGPARTNLPQSMYLIDNGTTVTEIDRAIKLNLQESALVGEAVPVSLSVFETADEQGLSIMAISPDGSLYPVNNETFTFNVPGKWGVIVLTGEEIILGKPIMVNAEGGILSNIDMTTGLLLLGLLVLLSLIPAWFLRSKKTKATLRSDPFLELQYKAYVVKKNINRFDPDRLKRVVMILREEYDELVQKGTAGKKDEAYRSIEELSTLSSLE